VEALSPPLALYCDEILVPRKRTRPVPHCAGSATHAPLNAQAIKAHLAEAIAAVEHKLEQQRTLSAEREQVCFPDY
jgi:hypothetical protein